MSFYDAEFNRRWAMYNLTISHYQNLVKKGETIEVKAWVITLCEQASAPFYYLGQDDVRQELLDTDLKYFQRLRDPYDLLEILYHCHGMLNKTEDYLLYRSRRDKLDLLRADD